MISQDPPSDVEKENRSGMESEQNDSLANKLSQELNNWRRRRTAARPRRNEADGGGNGGSQSEPARTIRVRGHETLVIRKPKMVSKPSNATDRTNQ